MTIDEAIYGLEHLIEKAADLGKQFTEEEIVRHGNVETGHMANSVSTMVYSMYAADVVVGTHYASYVNDGRGPVTPVNRKVLHWISPQYGEIFTKYAGPYAGSHFIDDAARRLDAYSFDL